MRELIISILLSAAVISPAFCQNEASLDWAVATALENNYGIRLSRLQMQSAEVQNSWGAAGALPYVGVSSSYSSTNDIADPDTKNNSLYTGASLNWVLFDGFGAVIKKDIYEQMETLAEGNLSALVEQTVQQVCVAYYQLLLVNDRAAVVEKQVALAKDLYDYQEERRKIGTAVTFDVLQAKTTWLEFKSAMVEQEINRADAERNLKLLIGMKNDDLPDMTDSLAPQFVQYSLDSLNANMLASNKNIKNQYIQLALKEADVKYAKSRYLPSFTASAGAGMFSATTDQGAGEIDRNGIRYSYGATLSIPLFAGGQRDRAVQLANIAKLSQEVSIEQITQVLDNSLSGAYETYLLNISLVELAMERLSAAKLNYEIAQEKFKTGSINSFNFRDVQNQFLGSELQVLQSKFTLLVAELELKRLSGIIMK